MYGNLHDSNNNNNNNNLAIYKILKQNKMFK